MPQGSKVVVLPVVQHLHLSGRLADRAVVARLHDRLLSKRRLARVQSK